MLARLRIGDALGPAVEGRLRRQADELGLGDGRVALDRLEQRAPARSASWSSTLHETWATPPRAASVRPMARRPGSPSGPPSRMARAMRLRVGAGRRRAELEVEGDERRAGGDEHRAGGRVHAVGPEVGRRPSAIRCARPAAPPRRSSARVRPPASSAVEEDGQAELAEGVGQRERLGQRGAALLRGRGRRSGATSMRADVRVQALRGALRSMRSIGFAGAVRQRLVAASRARPRA